MKKKLDKTFEEIISLENLFLARKEFLVGKKKKKDMQEFSRNLADNILALHEILLNILKEYITDENILCLLGNVVGSFITLPLIPSHQGRGDKKEMGRGDKSGVGLPLGNLTSQLFANVYMNVFDQWVKHKLNGIKDCPFGQGQSLAYLRYADDFVFLSLNRERILKIIPQVKKFLTGELKLTLHPDKIFLKTIYSGIDFLGWKHFPRHRVMRGTTKRRMFKRIKGKPTPEALQSYLGLLKHGNTFKLSEGLLMRYWLLRNI